MLPPPTPLPGGRRQSRWLRPLGIGSTLAAIAAFVLSAAFVAWQQNETRAHAEFVHVSALYQGAIERRLKAYQAATLSLSVAVQLNEGPVSRSRLHEVADAMQGANPIGPLGRVDYIERVSAARLDQSPARARPDYPARAGARPVLDSPAPATPDALRVRHRWPAAPTNEVIDEDVAASPRYRDAVQRAQAGAPPVLSEVFRADTGAGPDAVYAMVVAGAGAEGKRADSAPPAVPRWISVSLLASEMFREPLSAKRSPLAVHVVDVDGPDPDTQVVFDSTPTRTGGQARFSRTLQLSASGRTWAVTYATTPTFESTFVDTVSPVIAIAGAVVAGVTLLAFLGLHRAERSASARRVRSEARFELLNRALPMGVFEVDASGRCTYVNDGAAALGGRTHEALFGRGYLRAVHPGDRRRVLRAWREARATGKQFRSEHRLRTGDTTERWVVTEAVRHIGDGGRLYGHVGVCVEVTERRAFEQEAIEAQRRAAEAGARLLAAIDAMDAGFAMYGPDNRLVTNNARNRAFFGVHADVAVPGADKQTVLRALHRSLAPASDPAAEQAWVDLRMATYSESELETEECIGGRWFRIVHRRTTTGDTLTLRSEVSETKRRELELLRLATVASQTADGIAILDVNARIEWVNASWERLTGYALAEARGRLGRDFLPGPFTDASALQTITAHHAGQRPYEIEIQHYTKGGTPVWFEVRGQPIFDRAGQHVGFVQTRFDIRARKAAEAAAAAAATEQRRAEQRLRQSIDALDAAFALYDADERLIVCNQGSHDLFDTADGEVITGMTARETLARLCSRLSPLAEVPPDEPLTPQCSAWIEARLEEFRAAAGAHESRIGGRWYRTMHRRTPLGDTVSLRIDITEARAREEEHKRLAMIARETTDGIQILDTEGRARWVNPAFERLTGFTSAEALGKRGHEYLVGPATNQATRDEIHRCVSAGAPHHVEILHYTKAGEPRWWDIRAQPMLDDAGKLTGFFQTRFDITARKAAEAAAETALAEQRRAEDRLVQAIESLDAAFALYDDSERLVICNERNRDIAGAHGASICAGMSKREVLELMYDTVSTDPSDRDTRRSWIEARLREHREGGGVNERRIGKYWFRVTQRRTPLGDIVTLRTDITEIREREEQLAKLSMVASRTANSVLITDRDDRIEWVNTSFERGTGYALAEVIGRRPWDILPGPLTDPAILEEAHAMFAKGVAHRLELINYRRDGEPFWVSFDRQPVHDENGHVVRWIGLSLDISERKRSEFALKESEARNRHLAAVIQQTSEAVITKDLENRITTWNRAAEKLYGYRAFEAIGQLTHELLNPEGSEVHWQENLAWIHEGKVARRERRYRHRDGSLIDIEVSYAPQYDEANELIGQITVTRDITERVQAQRAIDAARIAAEQARLTMSTFLANMSHELRTPMHAILSFARLGQEKIGRQTPEKTLQYLDRIEQSGSRLLKLLNDLLDLSKLEAGGMPIEASRNDIRNAIAAAAAEIAPLAQARSITIEISRTAKIVAWFDPARLAQVLNNVLGNAVKFSPEGGRIEVRIEHAPAVDGRSMVQITVADNGVGIPKDEREQVFDKFIQSSKTRTGAGGTGLGLAISRELIRGHGGDIRAAENPRGGTLFIFTVPESPPPMNTPLALVEAA
ncbi:MAG: PAS domain S-box protein [Proteobacteria bacterium]|nr:PAS domain S-box protein [Burkholderiales bacterium]